MNIRYRFRISVYVAISMLMLVAITMICYCMGIDIIVDNRMDISFFDLLTGQIANTLIVLSLTSVLSTNFGQVYWVDIKDTKLVTPFWGCFIGITIYLLSALVFSISAYAIELNLGIVVSSIFSTFLLILLTYKMISIYFGKEELKKQLYLDYKYMLILKNTPYITDYLAELKKYMKELEQKNYRGKKKRIRKNKGEIKSIENEINSKNDKLIQDAHKRHIDRYAKCGEKLQIIDLKIQEYTRNAINNNEADIVRENIELWLECENYFAFIELVEELFEWDEKYTCRILKEIHKKKRAWVIKDKLKYFKKYALRKMISDSGKLDAIQNLLLIYDHENKGMSEAEQEIAVIRKKYNDLHNKKQEKIKEINKSEDFRFILEKEREVEKEFLPKYELLKEELYSLLKKVTTKDLRGYYLPLKEVCIAYDEGKYEIVNNYITVILENYYLDIHNIKMSIDMLDSQCNIEFSFSYVTDEEIEIIEQLIEKDKDRHIISQNNKEILRKMNMVLINNL